MKLSIISEEFLKMLYEEKKVKINGTHSLFLFLFPLLLSSLAGSMSINSTFHLEQQMNRRLASQGNSCK